MVLTLLKQALKTSRITCLSVEIDLKSGWIFIYQFLLMKLAHGVTLQGSCFFNHSGSNNIWTWCGINYKLKTGGMLLIYVHISLANTNLFGVKKREGEREKEKKNLLLCLEWFIFLGDIKTTPLYFWKKSHF